MHPKTLELIDLTIEQCFGATQDEAFKVKAKSALIDQINDRIEFHGSRPVNRSRRPDKSMLDKFDKLNFNR